MELSESMEDYLEAVLIIRYQNGEDNVRSIDIATYLSVSKPSVSHAVKLLCQKGYLEMDKDSFLHLTNMGADLAEKVYERHRFFSVLLTAIGVSEKNAVKDACRIEHYISKETFEKIRAIWSNYQLQHS